MLVTTDPDSLPTLQDLTGPCPRCGRTAAFAALNPNMPIKQDGSELANVLKCMGCNDSLVVIERVIQPSNPQEPFIREGIHWWPVPGSADLDPAIPPEVSSAFSEGMRALSVRAPRAAVVMFRGMLAQIVADKGTPEAQAKRDLYQQLDQMKQDGSLHPTLVEWAREIRVVGNAGAHPDPLSAVSEEEAADLGRLCRQMLSVIYELPAKITRSRAARGSAS
jgi:Domain of unknown function (DUF4145)